MKKHGSRVSCHAHRLSGHAIFEVDPLLGLFSIQLHNTLGTELILQQVLAKEPDHRGVYLYRIHDWDGVAFEEGLDSCRRYGAVAPGIGHSNHMPGHIYSKIGMWHEAARSMDAATRVDLRYMNEWLALPFETWNFAHNRNYLCYIQEQLGMPEASIPGGARSPRGAARSGAEQERPLRRLRPLRAGARAVRPRRSGRRRALLRAGSLCMVERRSRLEVAQGGG